MARPHPPADQRNRRSPEPLLYTAAQLLGRSPIRVRRRADKLRLAVHVAAVVGLVTLTVWWVVPLHAFAGPVLFTISPDHGVHVGDLPSLGFLALAARSVLRVARLARRG